MKATGSNPYFDPNGTGNTRSNIFGLPYSIEQSKLVFVPVPWDVTVSNREGTSLAPAMIIDESPQIDIYDEFSPEAWKKGMAAESIDEELVAMNAVYRARGARYIRFLEEGGNPADSAEMRGLAGEINLACSKMANQLEKKCLQYADNNQLVVVIGGDHSVSLGNIRAMAARNNGMGILQIDAHADLRLNYQGFTHSHASVMRNSMNVSGVSKLVQVGIRELCQEEADYIRENSDRITVWYDRDMNRRLYSGSSWHALCEQITASLPEFVYVSFDIDGLDPSFCPNTGTPVPGGLSYNQAMYLLEMVADSKRTIVGADLVENGPSRFDAMMACRILFRLAGAMIK